ncbi:MAG: RsiV family protein [Mobilitalea sp.]
MQNKRKIYELKEKYNAVKAPKAGLEEVHKSISLAKIEKKRRSKINKFRVGGSAVAAAALLLVVLPNTNSKIAEAMGDIPILGSIVRVVTIDKYVFDNGNSKANVEIPQIAETDIDSTKEEGTNTNAIDETNQEIVDYTDLLVKQFEKEVGDSTDLHKELDVTWEVVTDTKEWFTLRINVLEVQASGYEYSKFYHFNKQTGKIATLSDLFKSDADYVGVISENIKEQMRDQIEKEDKMYFIDTEDGLDNFEAIKPDQNFYFNTDNQLVIAFDEYEVAPGYMGRVEFVIHDSVLSRIRK